MNREHLNEFPIDTGDYGQAGHDIEIPDEVLTQLESREVSADQKQELLNKYFSTQRRTEMLHTASEDKKGRKVVYYRHTTIRQLAELFAHQEFSAANYGSHKAVDIKFLMSMLSSYAHEIRVGLNPSSAFREEDLESMLSELFPYADTAIKELLSDLSIVNVKKFVTGYCDPNVVKDMKSEGAYQEFIPFVSFSVGGPVEPPLGTASMCCIEAIIPDEDVITRPVILEEEKEVLVSNFSIESVSRIFISRKQFDDEIIKDPQTPIGYYYSRLHNTDKAVREWAKNEKTEDYLPVGLF